MKNLGNIFEAAQKPSKGAQSNITHVCVTRSHAYATDGYILAKKPIEVCPEDTGPLVGMGYLIPYVAAKAASKVVNIFCNGKVCISGKDAYQEFVPNTHEQFPPCDTILDSTRKNEGASVTLDAEYLLRLATALSDGKDRTVTLTLGPTHLSPVYVTSGVNKANEGVIMPVRNK